MRRGIALRTNTDVSSSIQIRAIEDVNLVEEDIVAIYRTGFALPPYNEPPKMADMFGERLLGSHTSRAGFECIGAFRKEELIGFPCGYHSSPGQYWHDLVRHAFAPEVAAEWMDDAFEFVELTLLPVLQGGGVDSRLHDELIRHRNERIAIATTVRNNNPAYDFYLRRGCQSLRDDFTFPGIAEPQVITGCRLVPV